MEPELGCATQMSWWVTCRPQGFLWDRKSTPNPAQGASHCWCQSHCVSNRQCTVPAQALSLHLPGLLCPHDLIMHNLSTIWTALHMSKRGMIRKEKSSDFFLAWSWMADFDSRFQVLTPKPDQSFVSFCYRKCFTWLFKELYNLPVF